MSIAHVLFGFSGRASRFHFWMGQVAILALLIVLFVAGASSLYALKSAANPQEILGALGFGMLVLLGVLVVLTWVTWAVAIKRLHDRNKSWVWMLITFIPTVLTMWSIGTTGLAGVQAFQSSTFFMVVQLAVMGWYLIELGFMPGTPGGNMWGPPPGGSGVFSPGFDDLLSDAPYHPQSEGSPAAAHHGAAAMAAAGHHGAVARVGSVQRSGGFGRRNARA